MTELLRNDGIGYDGLAGGFPNPHQMLLDDEASASVGGKWPDGAEGASDHAQSALQSGIENVIGTLL